MTTTESESKSAFGRSPREESESFGTWLRRHRELREITLREIADSSKISLRYLQALEEDRFDVLPAPVFAKGFLRQYARYVGIDPEEAVNFYLTADGQCDEEPEEEVHALRRPRAVGTWPYAVAVVVAAMALMAVVWMLIRLNRSSEDGRSGPDAQTAALVAAPQGAEPAAESGEPPAAEAGDQVAPPLSAAGVPHPGGAAPKEAAEEASPQTPESLSVTLDFRDDCWVRATVDGETREDRVYTQGESLQLVADQLVELELGNAFAVELEVEGHPMDLGQGSKSPVRRFTIDRDTAAALKRGGTR